METSFSFWVLWRKKQRWERSCSRLQDGFCFFSVSWDLFWYTIITAYNYCREQCSFSSSEMARKEMLRPQVGGQRTLRLQLQSSLHPLPGKQIIRWAIRAQINHHLTHTITVLGARHGRGTSMRTSAYGRSGNVKILAFLLHYLLNSKSLTSISSFDLQVFNYQNYFFLIFQFPLVRLGP